MFLIKQIANFAKSKRTEPVIRLALYHLRLLAMSLIIPIIIAIHTITSAKMIINAAPPIPIARATNNTKNANTINRIVKSTIVMILLS